MYRMKVFINVNLIRISTQFLMARSSLTYLKKNKLIKKDGRVFNIYIIQVT
jgi:hypothetical protein